MSSKLLLNTFLAFCLGLSSCASKPILKPDFSKKIEVKKSLFPVIKQSGEEVGIGYFQEHQDLEIRKDYVTLNNKIQLYRYGYFLGLGSLGYGLLADEDDFATYGYLGMISVFIGLIIQNRYGTFNLINKHNKRLEDKTTMIVPGYSPESREASIKAQIRF
jgi:hypothetical protein